MSFDPRICSQARLSRDARFDGRFFIGVKSTRIYCRPICPVRTVKEENVRYFPTAAAAAEAGYRPCLRCRPESSPGTPAWLGTSTTVSRALRLISESALEDTGVDVLAARLGIGSRQLRRLFVRHLGASPITVAKTRRLHFAKKLIDETNLPMGQIALASGFGSVRRFNAAFRSTYDRTPSQIRRFAHLASLLPANEYLFRLHFRPPFHWDSLLEFLARRAIPGVEAIESGCYRRTISLNGDSGGLGVSLAENAQALEVRISFPEPRWLFLIVERLRRMFDLSADPIEIAGRLSRDPLLANRIEAMPGLRVPGGWDGFELAVRAILGQQVSVAGASTFAGRLVRAFGRPVSAVAPLTHLFPHADALAQADVARIGLPQKRAETIRALARAVSEGQIDFGSVPNVEDFQLRLRELPGIGDWTAQYIAMRALGDPDAFPAGDLALLRSASLQSGRELAQRAEAWRPWRAYAAMYLWKVAEETQSKRHEERSNTEPTRRLSRSVANAR
jgi:AraC family transcriptional regulator, regulatory protein of adaptative response / DNA-3-methyladenine glycosylase II